MAKSVCWHTSSGEVASWSHHASRSKDHETWGGARLFFICWISVSKIRPGPPSEERNLSRKCFNRWRDGIGAACEWSRFASMKLPLPPTPELYVFSWSKNQHLTNSALHCADVILENLFVLSYVSLWLWLNFYEVSFCCMGEGTYWVLPLRTKLRPFKITSVQVTDVLFGRIA